MGWDPITRHELFLEPYCLAYKFLAYTYGKRVQYNTEVFVNNSKSIAQVITWYKLKTCFRSDWKYMSISDVPTMEMEDDYLERMDFCSYVVSQLD